MKRSGTTSSDFGLYKELENNRKKCLFVVCASAVTAVIIVLTIIYFVVVLSENEQISITSTSAQMKSINRKQPARPFEVVVQGSPPQHFTPTPPTFPPTTKKSTTSNYPRSNHYSQHQYPKSIQEVISYVKNKTVNTSVAGDVQSSTLYPAYTKLLNHKFHSYKPSDPSEINLLATGGVRFSPPVWKDFSKFVHKPIPIHAFDNNHGLDESRRHPRLIKNPSAIPDNTEMLATVKKPVMVSINIVPMESSAEDRYPGHLDKAKKDGMTLQLKVFPDMTYFEDQGDRKVNHMRY